MIVSNEEYAKSLLNSGISFRNKHLFDAEMLDAVPPIEEWEQYDYGWKTGDDGVMSWGGYFAPDHAQYMSSDGPNCRRNYAFDTRYGAASFIATAPMILEFEWRVNSERSYDYLTITVNGNTVVRQSGNYGWTKKSVPLLPGDEFKVSFSKDCCCGYGEDAGFIRNIVVLPFDNMFVPSGGMK